MAVTLNASASAGLITTADTSTILQLQTGGTTALAVSAAQVVTLTNPLPVASGGSGGTTSTGTGANVLGTTPSFTSTIGVGGATASASGAGITFPSTDLHYSTNANTLDDYEEGTFSPIIQSDSTGNFTMTVQYGRYTKIGRVVTIQVFIQWSARPSGGNIALTNLPFAVNNGGTTGGNAATAFQVLSATDTAFLNTNLSFDGTGGSASVYVYNFARSALTAVNSLSSAGFVAYSGTYYVS